MIQTATGPLLTWTELVKLFKSRENKELVLLAQQDAVLLRLLAAWPAVAGEVPLEVAVETGPADPAEWWEWLWCQRWPEGMGHPDYNRWGRLAGVSSLRERHQFIRARELRLVYPDGTVHSVARGFIAQVAAKKFQ